MKRARPPTEDRVLGGSGGGKARAPASSSSSAAAASLSASSSSSAPAQLAPGATVPVPDGKAAIGVLRYTGCANFRQRVVFATLAGRRLRIDGIRDKDEAPGLKDFEASFIRLIDKLTNGCRIEINETGTCLRYSPGTVMGGPLEHDCGTSRSIGWFIEGLLPLLPFAKRATTLALSGITNDDADTCVDYLRTVTLPLLSHFGLDEGLSLTVNRRGAPPKGGGSVLFSCPVVRELRPLNLTDEGYIRRVRGVAYCTRVSPAMANRIVEASRGLLLPLLPDVYVYTDAVKGAQAGGSPGYGATLVASSTSGCVYGAQRATGLAEGVADALPGSSAAPFAAGGPAPPEDIGASAAAELLDEIARGGCIDTRSQPLVFSLMALGPQDVSRVRIGQLGAAGVATLRTLRDVFGVTFRLKGETADAAELARRAVTEQAAAEAAARERLGAAKKVAGRLLAGAGTRGAKGGEEEGSDDDRGEEEDDVEGDEDVAAAAGIGKRSSAAALTSVAKQALQVVPPPSAAVGPSRSARSVLASCFGLGFKNLAKSVT